MKTIAGQHADVPDGRAACAGARRWLRKAARCSPILLPLLLGVAGCISSSNPSPPARNTTVVVPPGSTVVCSTGAPPPCQ